MWSKFKAKLRGWRTVAWNSFVGTSGILLLLTDQLQTVEWSRMFTPSVVGAIIVGLSIVAIVLRVITTTAIGQK
jgi:hypothetical protein